MCMNANENSRGTLCATAVLFCEEFSPSAPSSKTTFIVEVEEPFRCVYIRYVLRVNVKPWRIIVWISENLNLLGGHVTLADHDS